MNYRDQWVTNEQGEKFLFTVEMQRRLDRLGLPVEPASLSQLEDTMKCIINTQISCQQLKHGPKVLSRCGVS